MVRRGHYAVEEIFKPHGIYGRWGWRGILAYAIGFGVHGPVLLDAVVHRADREGDGRRRPVAVRRAADRGRAVLLFARSIDVDAERRLAEREAEELEEMASEHAMPTATA